MANRLKMAKINAILTLRERGWSCRRIARELGIHRETVGRYVRLNESATDEVSIPAKVLTGSGTSKPAKVHAGSERPEMIDDPEVRPAGCGDHDSDELGGPILAAAADPADLGVIREAHVDAGSVTGGRCLSKCEPWRGVITEKLELGLSAQRIYQDLRTEHSFESSYSSVQRFVRRLRRASPLAFRRMECEPGDEAQVDFGTGAPVNTAEGSRRRTHVFRIVLSHSRKGYSEVVHQQTTENFIRCLENAFHHFGGVPKVLVIDNLRAAVKRADWYDPELNPKMQAFAEHYGIVVLPTRPYTPRHKGKIERGVGYVKDNALKGRTFTSLEQQNQHVWEWERTVADTRIHGTTRRQVNRLFEDVERSALQPLPMERFPFFHEASRRVHRDAHVAVNHAYYSVPPEYIARDVWARWDGRLVRIFNHRMEQIAVHAQQKPGRFSTQDQHIADEKISKVERGAAYLLNQASLIGPETERWAQAMLEHRGIEGVRVLTGLMSLAGRHSSAELERACATARSHGAYHLRVIRTLLKRDQPDQVEFEFAREHEIIRDLSEYDQIVRSAIRSDRRVMEEAHA